MSFHLILPKHLSSDNNSIYLFAQTLSLMFQMDDYLLMSNSIYVTLILLPVLLKYISIMPIFVLHVCRHNADSSTCTALMLVIMIVICFGESGYEGDSSDPDDDGVMMSFSDTPGCKISTIIPDFWLIARLQMDNIEVYFHCR